MARRQRKLDSSLRWGEGHINKRMGRDGEMRYQARWREGEGIDARWRSKTCMSEDAAEDHLRAIARKKRSGTYTPESQLTVSECVDEYMERKRSDWSPNTYGTNMVYRTRGIDPYLGSKRIVQLTGYQIQGWLDTLARSGRRNKSGTITGGLSRAMIASTRSLLNAALNDATRFGLLDRNPATGTKAGGRRPVERPVWSSVEASRVLAGTIEIPIMHVMYALALLTGMRPGEIRGLHWRDVDLNEGIVSVRTTVTRDDRDHEVVGTTTKTGTARRIRITEELIEILRVHRREQVMRRLGHPGWHDTDLLLDRGDGRFIPQSTLHRRHLAVVAEIGVTPIRLHDLRHTYTSLQADSGVNPRVIMDALGHSRLSMTLERYTHASTEMRTAAAATISRRLLGDPSRTTTSDGEDERKSRT